MRATILLSLLFSLLTGVARAQAPLDLGSPETAFAGGPMRLSKNAIAVLRSHYQGDKVPLVPQPFRGKLDTALLGRDWARVESLKKELAAAQGVVAALAWEQSRFIATGSIGVAEMHALDVAATGSTGLSETAAMMWFYAVAVTMTDGHKCADDAAKDAHLDRLRGPAFEPVTRIVRTLSDDRLAAMRDLAIRLEFVLAPDRSDDLMCRGVNGKADLKPEAVWRPEASMTRGMLPKHLVALASVMRPHPIARQEPPKALPEPVTARSAPTKTDAGKTGFPGIGRASVDPRIEPAIPRPEIAEPVLAEPPKSSSASAAQSPVRPEPPEPVRTELVDPKIARPNPGRFEPPKLELSPPEPPKQ
jgi:hypothetical protein